MPATSLRFRIEGDNSSALRSLSDVKRSANDLGSELQRSIGDKMKSVFSVTVVEEVVRRTGEWATELQRSSRELGVTAEQLQTIRVMAERAGVAQDKIFSFYERLESRATQAANGNTKLLRSFNALGISMSDLKGPNRLGTAELFQKTLGGVQNEGAMQNIYGSKNYLELRALGREAGGKSLAQYQESRRSQIVSNETVDSMSQAWIHIIEDIRSLGNKLRPIVGLVLTLVDGILKMVNGVVGEVGNLLTGGWKGIKALFGGNKAGSEFVQWGKERELRNKASLAGAGNFLTFGLGNFKVGNTEAEREAAGGAEGLLTALSLGAAGPIRGARIVGEATKASEVMGANPAAVSQAIKAIGENASIKQLNAVARGVRTVTAGRLIDAGRRDIQRGLQDTGDGSLITPPTRTGLFGNKIGSVGGGEGGHGNLAMGGVFGIEIQSKIIDLNKRLVDIGETQLELLEKIVQNTNALQEQADELVGNN